MKEQIISAAIESLRQEGLKFSVDTLANKLKISKKTIYKFFPDKEALTVALYEKYYADIKNQAKALIAENALSLHTDLLSLYFDSKIMTRKDIFNKYKLNDAMYSFAEKQNDALWEIIRSSFGEASCDSEAIRIIIDGSFEKLCHSQLCPDAVIERLVNLL
ncbi:MAG: TetR/AcrR family transcriptional regulator [Acutalibacteraceae bacterium]